MQDAHVNLVGFLEGNRHAPLRWSSTVLCAEPTPEEWRSIYFYRIRSREYLANVEELGLGRTRSLSVDSGSERISVSASSYPGRHRAKSLYLDFRHFLAEKEPSKFERVVHLLRRYLAPEEPLQKFLLQLKQQFRNGQGANIDIAGQRVQAAELVRLWFNTELFHAGTHEQIQERDRWLKIMEDEGVHHLMFWAVVGAAHEIKALYACLKDLEPGGERRVHCPDIRIVERSDA